jgi:VIT1/CCC1 family predicted Fe2+/Mn2+ transporter
MKNEKVDCTPIDNAISTFVGFSTIGFIPLIPFIILFMIGSPVSLDSFTYSIMFTCIAFFLIGIIRGKILKKSLLRSGFHTLAVGGIAATVAYIIGNLLNSLI